MNEQAVKQIIDAFYTAGTQVGEPAFVMASRSVMLEGLFNILFGCVTAAMAAAGIIFAIRFLREQVLPAVAAYHAAEEAHEEAKEALKTPGENHYRSTKVDAERTGVQSCWRIIIMVVTCLITFFFVVLTLNSLFNSTEWIKLLEPSGFLIRRIFGA